MWQLAPDYVTRVLQPAAQRFADGNGLPDVFERYDLPLDVSSHEDIGRALNEVQSIWEQQRNDAVIGKLVNELLSPAELSHARQTLLDKKKRALARKMIEHAQREALKSTLAGLMKKGYVTAEERADLIRRYSMLEVSAIDAQIGGPMRARKKALPFDELSGQEREQIRSDLAVLLKRDLFDFLGLDAGVSASDVASAYQKARADWQKRPDDARKTAALELLTLIERHFLDREINRFELLRQWNELDALLPSLRALLSKGGLDAPAIEAFVARATESQVEEMLARTYVAHAQRDADAASARAADVQPAPQARDEPTATRPQPQYEEFQGATVMAADAVVEGHWAPPSRGRVRVFKCVYGAAETELDNVGETGFTDYEVRNNVMYTYRLAVETPDESAPRLSAGLRFSVTPAEILAPVESLEVRTTGDGVRLCWPMLRRGTPVALRFSQAPPWPLGRVIKADERGDGEVIPLMNEREALDATPLQKKAFYVVLAVSGPNATVGKAVRFLALPDLTALTTENFTEYVQIRWRWPPACRVARIGWRKGEPPATSDDPEARFSEMGKGEYNAKGSLRVPLPGTGIWYFRGFAWHDESRSYSAGISGGANARVQFQKALVQYSLTRGLVRRRMTVTIHSDHDIILPSLVIVAAPGDLQPLRAEQGQEITRLPKIPLRRGQAFSQEIELNTVRRPAYLRAFFADIDAYDDVDLRHPEPRQARIR